MRLTPSIPALSLRLRGGAICEASKEIKVMGFNFESTIENLIKNSRNEDFHGENRAHRSPGYKTLAIGLSLTSSL